MIKWVSQESESNECFNFLSIEKNLNPYLTSYIDVNVKWDMDLNVRVKTIWFLEDNTGNHLYNLQKGKVFVLRK